MIHYIFYCACYEADNGLAAYCKKHNWKVNQCDQPRSGLCGSEAPMDTLRIECPLSFIELREVIDKNNIKPFNMDWHDDKVDLINDINHVIIQPYFN